MDNPLKNLKYLKIWEIIAIIGLFLFVSFLMFGQSLAYDNFFTDDFEAYSTGNLNGQGTWVGDVGFQVVLTKPYYGVKSIYYAKQTAIKSITATTTPASTGQVSFYFYIGSSNTGVGGYRPTISLVGCLVATPASCYALSDNDVYYDGDSYNFTIREEDETKIDIVEGLSLSTWYQEVIEFDIPNWQYRAKIVGYDWSDWVGLDRSDLIGQISFISKLMILVDESEVWIDDFGSEITPPNLFQIDTPVDGSTLSSEFTISGNFEEGEGYNKIMVILEDWDASSTCPAYGSEQYDIERPLYFNYQSLPYFSQSFSMATGTADILVNNLQSGNYQCIRCYFINETTGGISEEICEGYNLIIDVSIPFEAIPNFVYPFTDWQTYYASATDKWTTSTGLFSSLANAISPLITWVGNLSVSFKTLLSTTTGASYGTQFGNAIPVMRGYLVVVNNFFNGLPVSEVFIFFIVVAVLILIYKLIHSFITLIKP